MKFEVPNESNRSAIKICPAKTFQNRKKWIDEKNPTIPQIFVEYPRLMDYGGEMASIGNITNTGKGVAGCLSNI